jgi:putative phosphoesterase
MSTDKRIVILADTHVGDRTAVIEPSLFRAIDAEHPDRIFHAGDVCKPEAIQQLSHIAPTDAVQGNRDWFMGYRLPMECHHQINGVRLTLAHGHISIWQWFLNYVVLFLFGTMSGHRHFQAKLAQKYPEADVIIYGHIHSRQDEVMDGIRFINPGAGYPERRNQFKPQYAVLTVTSEGEILVDFKSVQPDAQASV